MKVRNRKSNGRTTQRKTKGRDNERPNIEERKNERTKVKEACRTKKDRNQQVNKGSLASVL